MHSLVCLSNISFFLVYMQAHQLVKHCPPLGQQISPTAWPAQSPQGGFLWTSRINMLTRTAGVKVYVSCHLSKYCPRCGLQCRPAAFTRFAWINKRKAGPPKVAKTPNWAFVFALYCQYVFAVLYSHSCVSIPRISGAGIKGKKTRVVRFSLEDFNNLAWTLTWRGL